MTAVVPGVFAFKAGDLVLVKWNDSMVYFAKIKKIDQRRKKCVVVFDDKSQDEADFDQIHSVDETTTDIICIKCKKDDSDSPNEIVLCDRCGIGYHQKCHLPPIPASALELDTPWNCVYCLKGVKCPYLTESLDVLQNLLSDEESQSHDDLESVTTVESDEGGDDFVHTQQTPQQHGKFLAPPRPHKKRGRKPKVKRGPKPKDPVRSPTMQMKKEISDERSLDSPSSESAGLSVSVDQPLEALKRKRSQFAAVAVRKRPRKSSVQSQTLSVTRISVPVHRENGSPKSDDIPEEEETCVGESPTKVTDISTPVSISSPLQSSYIDAVKSSSSKTSDHSQTKKLLQFFEKKPRSLRVSLTLPDEVEPGSPMEKVKKSQKLLSPKFAINLPAWDEPETDSSTDNAPNKVHSTPAVQSIQSPITSRSPTPKSEDPLTPFTASALPLQVISSKPEPGESRKRDRDNTVESHEISQKKIKLSPPQDSISDNVFSPPKTAASVESESTEINATQTTTTASNDVIDSPMISKSQHSQGIKSSVVSPSATTKLSASAIDTISATILPSTSTITPPVGYGAIVEVDRPQTVDKPSVITVKSDKKDVGVGSSPTPHPLAAVISSSITMKEIQTKDKELTQSQSVIRSPLRNVAVSSNSVAQSGLPITIPQTAVVNNAVLTASDSTPLLSGTTGPKAHSVTSSKPISNSTTLSLPLSSSSGGGSATAVSVITVSPSSSAIIPTSSTATILRPATPPPTTAVDCDIMITNVETPTTNISGNIAISYDTIKTTESYYTSSKASTPLTAFHQDKSLPQNMYTSGKQRTGMRITAKIAEVPTQKSVLHEKANHTYNKPQTGIISSTVVSKSPVSGVPLVTTPTVYSQPSPGSTTAYTLVQTDAGGQGVAIAMPSTGVVKPGTLPINNTNTTVVLQQTPHSGPSASVATVQYIIEPLAASTPVLNAHTHSRAINGGSSNTAPVYHTRVVGSRTMPVTTTKPYAIVPAQPTASMEIQGIAVDQRGTPAISPPIQIATGGYSMVQGTPYIQTAVTSNLDAKQNSVRNSHAHGGTKSNPRQRVLDEEATAQLDEIGKKIGDAFASSSEQMLIAAFEDAWKKFQANGKRYQTTSSSSSNRRIAHTQEATTHSFHSKSSGPPNAEVVSVPGTSSRLSLIRPTYSRSKISALQQPNTDHQVVCVSADPKTITVSPSHELQQKKQIQYVYYSADGSGQPQHYAMTSEYPPTGTTLYAIAQNNAQPSYDRVIKQAQRQGKSSSQKKYQVQSTGVYIPAHATEVGSNKQATIVLQPVVSDGGFQTTSRNQQIERTVQQKQTGSEKVSASTVAMKHLSVLSSKPQSIAIGSGSEYAVINRTKSPATTTKTVRQCALCTKEATYLCSGCQKIWYCGRDCQLKAWDEHSETCQA